jgi:hypothetical protein
LSEQPKVGMRDFFRFRQGAQFGDHNYCVIPRQMSKEELRKRIERDPQLKKDFDFLTCVRTTEGFLVA